MKIKHIVFESLFGFILWTLFLSPYMIFIVQTTIHQYITWLIMQLILVTPIAPVVFRLTNFFKNKLLGENKNELL